MKVFIIVLMTLKTIIIHILKLLGILISAVACILGIAYVTSQYPYYCVGFVILSIFFLYVHSVYEDSKLELNKRMKDI